MGYALTKGVRFGSRICFCGLTEKNKKKKKHDGVRCRTKGKEASLVPF